MRLTKKRGWLALGLLGVAVIGATAWEWTRPWRRQVLMTPARAAFLQELQPVALKNCELKRYGGQYDGYLLCDNLSEGIQSAYSYGVGPFDIFACDISKRYSVPVHQYDCFDPSRPTCSGGNFVFNNECIGPRAEKDKDQRVFDTLQNHIVRNKDVGKRLIVKLDVEGAEWQSLLATPDAVLDQIDQLPIELHMMGGIKREHTQTIRKLKEKFHIVNLHFNNSSCTPELDPIPAYAFQVLLVNKRLGVIDPSAPTPAPISALNIPDNPALPDCQVASARR